MADRFLLLRLFLPFGLGYFVSYVFRTVNAVIAPNLVADLGLTPADLGLLTSAYFLTFAAFQLPLGMLLDRFGSRRVEAGLLLFAAFGAWLFSQAEALSGLLVGRALIGLGVSACLMAAFKAFSAWLPVDRLPFANGVQMVSGGLGALTATTPVEAALKVTDWRGVFLVLAVLALLAALTIFLVVPDQQKTGEPEPFAAQVAGLKTVLRHPDFWKIAPWAFTGQAAYLSIQGLWSGPWLRDVAGFARPQVADLLFWIAAAMVVGYFGFGSLAARLSRYGIRPAGVAAAGMGIFLLVQILLVVMPAYPGPLWIAFGLFGTACILPYAVLAQVFPQQLTGRCNTSLNLLVFICAFVAQWLIGAVIGLWPVTTEGGYQPIGYQAAFLILIGFQLLAACWFLVRGKSLLRRD